MKRAHRRLHFGMWVIIGPLIMWLLVLAFKHLPEKTGNEAIPDVIVEEPN